MSESHRPFAKVSPSIDQSTLNIPSYYPDHPVTRNDWAGYLTEVNKADNIVGKVIADLEKRKLLESTIIVFLSDHGRPMLRAKNWLYDSGTRIPLIIRIPDTYQRSTKIYTPGTSNSQLISSVDLVAETLGWASVSTPKWMQGRRFLDDSPPRSFLISAIDRVGNINTCSRAIRTKDMKFIQHFKPAGSITESSTHYRRATHPLYHLIRLLDTESTLSNSQSMLLKNLPDEELYHIGKDPEETHNLIGNPEYLTQTKALKSQLMHWIQHSGDRGLEKDNPEIIQHFEDYGENQHIKRHKHIQKLHHQVREKL